MIGKTLSHYKVIEKIGQGGMGEVYRAEDTNLSREVAIKVLPEQFTQDPQRLARFEREAKLLASLNHPNIAAIYGLEEADGVRFLSLELVEGETLAGRVAKGPVPINEALEICRQIAEGVEAAHEKGVIHRDLKPANVKVTPEGKVKILDFGLAKAFEGEIPVADISQSPTLTEEMTRAGVIMGTAAYMSPEQARGKAVDRRADIFAFGAVLYELLTGKRAFGGETVTDTLAKVLEGEPNWKALPRNTPGRISELLADCLEKEFNERLPDIGSARIQIKRALKGPTPALPAGRVSAVDTTLWRSVIPWGIAGLAVVGAVLAWLSLAPPPPQPLRQFVVNTPPSVTLFDNANHELAISPDGRNLVYRASGELRRELYVRSLEGVVDRPIAGTPDGAINPFFSSDGETLGFIDTTNGTLSRIPLRGGSPIALCAVSGNGRYGTWLSEQTIVFSGMVNNVQGLYQVSSSGGEPVLLASPNADQGELRFAVSDALPDEETILYTITKTDQSHQIATLSVDTGETRIVVTQGRQASHVPTGHLVYELNGTGNLMAVPFNVGSLEVTGEPVQVLQGVRGSNPGFVDFAVSKEGTLVFAPGGTSPQNSFVWVDRDGGETPISEEKRDFRVPRVSPDGKQFAFIDWGMAPQRDVWTYDISSDSFSRLTFEEIQNGTMVWSPDGKFLVYQTGQPGARGMVRQPADRSLPPEWLSKTPTNQMPSSWSSDGKLVAFNENIPESGWDIGVLEMDGDGQLQYILTSTANECCPKFSPDGKWLAYVSDETGQDEVYVRPYPGPDVKWSISGKEGGQEPVWSPDGQELFYRGGTKMFVVSIEKDDQTLKVGRPEVLFEGSYIGTSSSPPGFQYYDIEPEGRRFLMIKDERSNTSINVVLNWFEEVKRLVN